MAGNYSYDRLPTLHESQDIADQIDNAFASQTTLQPLSLSPSSAPPSYTQVEQRNSSDRTSLKSFDTYISSSSSVSSFEKLKSLGNRIRRKPLPGYLKGSIRRHPVAEIEPTRIGRGVWTDQLLVDRSLRTMALLMTLFAVAMFIVIFANIKTYYKRANKETSSVGGETKSCKEVTRTNTALLLLINVAATMVLGMSNTYQQLVTSLNISDLKHMLQKFGDSRVGTNSPFNINHKKEGKKKAWAAWVLLIFTSMPVHFLANSLIGPSYISEPPSIIEFSEHPLDDIYKSGLGGGSMYGADAFVCWSAFRTGKAHFPKSTRVLEESIYQDSLGQVYSRMTVNYLKENCSELFKTAADVDALENSYDHSQRYIAYGENECWMGRAVICDLLDPVPAKCRLNVRMNAAFILASCLAAKAIYMLAVNLLARGKLKRHCLTFGDVIVASASNPELRVQGECMVNAGDSFRRHHSHTCHKHCKSKEESKTGDEIGHCQKCKKWNSTNKFANEPQPTIATKIKKSLISNLGNTALTQMCLMMICSICLTGASIALAVPLGIENEYVKKNCKGADPWEMGGMCGQSQTQRFEEISGGWGGFNRSKTAAALAPDQMSNEVISFCISNGAQFIYSLLYLMMIYNITLVSQENDWGKLEWMRRRLRCTTVKGESFSQSYLLQLPKKILFPVMVYSVLTHWMLGEALQTQEAVWLEHTNDRYVEHSQYIITYAAYPLWVATFLILLMTGVCWWAFTYKREGFIPQMFGSIRTLCAATTQLDDFPSTGIQWGDLGMGKQFRHAGLSAEEVMQIVPNELYAGIGEVAHQYLANSKEAGERCQEMIEVKVEGKGRIGAI